MVSCERCGRTLTNPHSIARGYGSFCASKIGAGYGTSTWQHPTARKTARYRHGQSGGIHNLSPVSSTVAVNMGINLLAVSVPPVGTLMAAYDVVQSTGEIITITNQAIKTYEATGSVEQVVRKVGPKIMNMVYEQAKSQVIDAIIPGNDIASVAANSALRSIL